MLLVWYDPDRATPASAKAETAIARYRERCGSEPAVILTSYADAADLAREGFTALPVAPRTFIGRFNLYVGVLNQEVA